MGKFIIRRISTGILVLFFVITITFVLSRVVPSDPAAKWVGAHATHEQKAAAIIELGLDKPIFEQYVIYLKSLLKGDLGTSITSHRPVLGELLECIPNTLELVLLSTICAFILGLPIGVYSAVHENTFFDHAGRFISISVISMPSFWIALMLQILFATKLGWLPLSGQMGTMTSISNPIQSISGLPMLDCVLTGNWTALRDVARHSVLPVMTLMAYDLGLTARQTRSILLEVLNEDYIRASRAYGIRENLVIWRYAVKNVLGTLTTVLALAIGHALVATFVMESVFSWPGVGSYISNAVMNLDYPAIIGVTLFSAMAYVLLNFLADLVVALDLRTRITDGRN